MADRLKIKQGTTRYVVLSELRDAAGNLLDPTGWAIHAVARPGMWSTPIATWRNNPTPPDLLAEVVDADPLYDPTVEPGEKWIYLHIDPAVSDTWTWTTAQIDVELREPSTAREEAFSSEMELVPTTVRTA